MYKAALALASAALMLTTTTAAAQEHEPPEPLVIDACDGKVTVEVIKDNTKFREGESSFAVTGNFVFRVSDEDSSVVVRVPGRVSGELTETGAVITNFGRTLLLADSNFPLLVKAIAEAGLPELPLIIGKVVITETVNAEGDLIDTEITSIRGRVVDVCELLER